MKITNKIIIEIVPCMNILLVHCTIYFSEGMGVGMVGGVEI